MDKWHINFLCRPGTYQTCSRCTSYRPWQRFCKTWNFSNLRQSRTTEQIRTCSYEMSSHRVTCSARGSIWVSALYTCLFVNNVLCQWADGWRDTHMCHVVMMKKHPYVSCCNDEETCFPCVFQSCHKLVKMIISVYMKCSIKCIMVAILFYR